MPSDSPQTLLFICTGNTCRSPMAERLATARCADLAGWRFTSAGVFASPGAPASGLAVAVLKELDISLDDHKSRALSPNMIREADRVVTMTRGHRDLAAQMAPDAAKKIHTLHSFGVENREADVMDPFGGGLDTYRLVRDEIDAALPDLILAVLRPQSPQTP